MFQFPGLGLLLTKTLYPGNVGTAPEPVQPPVSTLGANEYSNYFPLNAGAKAVISIIFATAPGSTTTIQIASDPTFANYQETTIPSQATTFATWQSTNPVMGVARVKNTSGASISAVYGNVLVATVG